MVALTVSLAGCIDNCFGRSHR